jgi:methylphosphotriester-DNA--protein-cysteine methyltransferase
MLTEQEKYDFIGFRDTKYDGLFYTAVKTTGIFCLPSCRAKKPKKENVIFYDTREDALKNGFRACKICKA